MLGSGVGSSLDEGGAAPPALEVAKGSAMVSGSTSDGFDAAGGDTVRSGFDSIAGWVGPPIAALWSFSSRLSSVSGLGGRAGRAGGCSALIWWRVSGAVTDSRTPDWA